MTDPVTWAQLTWAVGALAAAGAFLFAFFFRQLSAAFNKQAEAEKSLSAAIKGLDRAMGKFQVEVAKERASNSYVAEVKRDLGAEIAHMEDRLNSHLADCRQRGI